MDQRQMADLLTATAERVGLRLKGRYDNTVVSKLENGRRDLSVDDLVLYAAVDPLKRGEGWIALGTLPAQGFVPRQGKRPASPVEPETPRRQPSKQGNKRRA